MSKSISAQGPQFNGRTDSQLREWAVKTRLPWLAQQFGLVAGLVLGCLSETLRRELAGLGASDPLPAPIDWTGSWIGISDPGTGKGMAWFPAALEHYRNVRVLVPSVVQATKLEASIDELYRHDLGGCMSSQRKSPGMVQIWTTGIFHQAVHDQSSELWADGTTLMVDEAQRILEGDLRTEFLLGYMASNGLPVGIVSATIAPGRLPEVFGHGSGNPAPVYQLSKAMHEVKLEQVCGDKPDQLLLKLEELYQAGTTTLVFCPSRAEVQRVVKMLNKHTQDEEHPLDVWAVGVTGADIVERQLRNIEQAQSSGKPVVVVATPGTMDSSVTIPGLTTVVIIDRRFRVDWNRSGVLERWSEPLPINHIWQMIRRVGRQQRQDGGLDKVYVLSAGERQDILAERPVFEPLTGCSPWHPLESTLLEAVKLNVKFEQVQEYMLSTFTEDRRDEAIQRLLDHGMIERSPDPADPDGYVLTEKGALTVELPFEDYRWDRLVAEAPRDLQLWLALIASCGELRDLESFKTDFQVEPDKESELLRKLQLMISYIQLGHDEAQEDYAFERGLSFRRIEQAEKLFEMAARALGLQWSPKTLRLPDAGERVALLRELVTGGLRTGLFDLYLIHRDERGRWMEGRQTGESQEWRRFEMDRHSKLDLQGRAVDGVVPIVASTTWWEDRNGNPCGDLNDASIVPADMVAELIASRAASRGWFKLTFELGPDSYGDPELRAKLGGMKYVPARGENKPVAGKAYWCSVSRDLTSRVSAVWVHYPA